MELTISYMVIEFDSMRENSTAEVFYGIENVPFLQGLHR